MRAIRDERGEGSLEAAFAASEPAPAKINLALHITGRRDDGYHSIDSLVVFAALGDELRLETADAFSLTLSGPFAAALASSGRAEDNLVLRAAREMTMLHPSIRLGARLLLDKCLPVASGIGGGSADAAATLRLIDHCWRLNSSAEELARLGRNLGADVPMCLLSKPLGASGIGDIFRPVSGMPSLPLLLVNPGVALSTKAVFSRLSAPFDPGLPMLPARFSSPIDLVAWLGKTGNGLQAAAREEAPIIDDVLAALAGQADCMLARMSGSGATCFGIFPTLAAAEGAASRLKVARPDWWVSATLTGAS